MTRVFDNSGSLRKNKAKEKDSQPDLKGQATVAGVAFWISGWRKEGEDGAWYSLSFTPKDEDAPVLTRPKSKNGNSDDIPW